MLQLGSTRTGYAIAASDGAIGHVRDFLFDDRHWRVRWLVVDTGSWLTGRKVLIHPSAIAAVDDAHETIGLALTMAQVRDSPALAEDEPVSQQMEQSLYSYYGWNSLSGGGYFVGNAIATPFSAPSVFGGGAALAAEGGDAGSSQGDPHLRSLAEVTGYHIDATDGEIGHLSDVMVEDSVWSIAYMVIATRNWWPGQHVLVSPDAVSEIRWSDRRIVVDVTREKIRCSPAWDPNVATDLGYISKVDEHYGWHANAR
jgi:hypothetical protein